MKELKGNVIEAYAGARFLVEFDAEKKCNCYLSGKMKLNKIKVSIGDKVTAIVEPDWSNGRIIRRI